MQIEIKQSTILAQFSSLLTQNQLVPVGLDQEHLKLFCHFDDAGIVVGVIGVEVYGSACLLRSLAVQHNQRQQGIARNLINEALEYARSIGSIHVYLLTETIGATMKRYGFKNITRDSVPVDMLKSPFFNGLCPCACEMMYQNIINWGGVARV